MNLKVAQVLGLNTDQKAAQVIYTPVGEDNSFLAVLDLSCDDAFTKGRQILSELSDFYFDFEGTPAEKIKATFEKAKQNFKEEGYSLLVSSVSGKVLYLINKGGVEVYLKRGDDISSLTALGGDSQLISGFLQNADRLLFSTKSLISFLGEDLKKSLDLPLETFEEEVSDRLGTSDLEDQGLAALAIEVEKKEEQPQNIEKENIPNLQKEYKEENMPDNISDADQTNKLFGILKTSGSKVKHLLSRFFPKSGRSRLILALILIAVVASGIVFKVIASKNAKIDADFNQFIQQAKDDFNAAKNLSSLNPTEAKNKLETAKEKVNKAISLKPKNSEAQDLKKQIERESDSILQQSEASNFPEFLDLDLVKKNFRAQNLSLSAGKLLVMDSTAKTLVVIDLAKKSNQILAGSEQVGEAKFASLNGALGFVFSQDKGVLKIDTSNQKITTVSKADKGWGDIKDIYGFASNIYLLDAGNNMIWKYLPTSDGYSDKREYLTKNIKVDLSNTLRMQIESSIYVLKSGGEILRFTKGDKDNFGLEGLDKGIKDPKSFFVSSDTDNLYILDSGNSRLLILTKTGTYKSQITGAKFAQATDLVVDEKEKKVYLLEGGKIYTVDLK